ncbi:E3 ubiquitin-protein ligase TRIM39 [Gadus morhua]|nr:E3 ubiquitin-protein ligase TRIM39-like [Gadus morhua]
MSCTGETISAKNERESTCPICLQLFSEPMSLPCGHIYCLPCLQTMSAGLDQNNCPECQQEYGGTDALVKNMKMCSMVEAHKAALGSDVNANKSYLDCGKEMTATEHREVTCYCYQATEPAQSQLNEPEKQNPLEVQDGYRTELDSSGPLPVSPKLHLPTPPKPESNATKKTEMEEPKFRLASQLTELTVRLDMAECALRKEKEREEEVSAANEELRAAAAKLLHDIQALSLTYSEAVTRLIEGELSPGEGNLRARVSQASQLTEQLRHTVLSAESLLTEDDKATFTEDLNLLQPRIAQLMSQPQAGEEAEPGTASKRNVTLACAKLEAANADFKAGTGDIHRALRNLLNPSEVTFDPDTAHPNLVLSGDMKTVTYGATKQAYPTSPERFTSFLQVLSSQSFSGGEHCWRVELEGAPWAIGVCYSGRLARSGLPSALESSRSSWCLMWSENRLRAFERGHDVPLKLTTLSRTLEVRLSFKSHRLSFYNVCLSGEKTHVYTFNAVLTEPVHVAYRMMSAHPKARITIGEALL